LIGNVGSGKTLSAVAMMRRRQCLAFSNINASFPFITRLRIEHIITKKKDAEGKKKYMVNWEFWREQLKEHKSFDIYIDELHNIAHARTAMSSWNVCLTRWIAQIRKILGTNEKRDIILISQRLGRIDIAFRELLHEVIYCRKFKLKREVETSVYENGKIVKRMLPEIRIMQYHFVGEDCIERYEAFRAGLAKKSYKRRTMFKGNPLLRYYNSYEIVDFGESEFL
jgi:hypothetical protein